MKHAFVLAFAAAVSLVAPTASADPQLSVFANIDGRLTNATNTSSAFALGDLDLYLTAPIGDHFDTLGEISFEASSDGFTVDVERAQLRYSFSDALRFGGGRYYSHIGYYNQVFHHGAFIYATVDRPLALLDEDDGGLIPVHSLGAFAEGSIPISSRVRFNYALDFTNGRPARPVGITDGYGIADSGRAFNLSLSVFVPHLGLRLGGSALIGNAPPLTDAGTTSLPTRGWTDEMLFSAFLAVTHGPLEIYAEQYVIRHSIDGINVTTLAGFAQMNYRFGILRPFVRLDYRHFDHQRQDTYYVRGGTQSTEDEDVVANLGAALEVTPGVVLKLQYAHDFTAANNAAETLYGQLAWRF